MAEFGQVHRHEFSGALNGLLCVRRFAKMMRIFCYTSTNRRRNSVGAKIIDEVYQVFGFQYEIELSTRPDDFMGDIMLWNQAEAALKTY